jgi:hypothetical protein
MKRMRILLACLAVFGCTAGTSGPGAIEPKAVADAAMRLVVADKVDEAFAVLKPHWPFPQNEFDTIVLKTIQQRNLLGGRFGKPLAYELIGEEKLSNFGTRLTYAEKREMHVVRWQFTFYRPKDEWKVNSVFWDDNFGLLF